MLKPNPSTPQKRQSQVGGVPEPLLQADTFVRSASNLATGGLANNAEAAMDAMFDQSPGDWLDHYKAALREQLARDAYDASHRRLAVALGNGLGVGLLAGEGFLAGARGSAALPVRMKGQLGEGLSVAKTVLQGDRPVAFQARKVLDNGKGTVLDHATANGTFVEAKFGPSARLSTNQKYAQKQFGPLYRVDHWMPRHVGMITAPLGPTGGGLLSWGMHHLNAPRDAVLPGDTPPDNAPPEGSPDGGYEAWQEYPDYPGAK